jgi:HSP20 family protein
MSTQRIWDPFNDMLSLRDAMGQLLESSFVRPGAAYSGAAQASSTFPLNVHGTADELKIEALLPGFSQEDVNVDIDRGVLTISARRHGPEIAKGAQWYLREFHPGQFSRSLSLPFPVEIEQVGATFTNGILTLTLPRAEAAKPRRIPIGSGQRTEQLNATNQQ